MHLQQIWGRKKLKQFFKNRLVRIIQNSREKGIINWLADAPFSFCVNHENMFAALTAWFISTWCCSILRSANLQFVPHFFSFAHLLRIPRRRTAIIHLAQRVIEHIAIIPSILCSSDNFSLLCTRSTLINAFNFLHFLMISRIFDKKKCLNVKGVKGWTTLDFIYKNFYMRI